MKNSEFCTKVTRMLGGSVELVEIDRDCFRVQAKSAWLKGGQSIFLSDDFIEWVRVFAWKNFRAHVKWDNLNLAFWFEATK